jgi:uncharacterized membrane protein
MTVSPLLAFHVGAGTVGVLSGALALCFRKGSRRHRGTGLVFAVSMLALSASGLYVAGFVRPSRLNGIAGLLTLYLVATGWSAVRRKPGRPDTWDVAALLLALGVGATAFAFAWGAAHRSAGATVGYAIFGSVALLFAGFDVRMIVRGGVSAAQRIGRHLWRMGLALWIAVASLFLGQARVFPAALREAHVLPVPVLVLAAVLVFWLWRVVFTGASRTRPVSHVRTPGRIIRGGIPT